MDAAAVRIAVEMMVGAAAATWLSTIAAGWLWRAPRRGLPRQRGGDHDTDGTGADDGAGEYDGTGEHDGAGADNANRGDGDRFAAEPAAGTLAAAPESESSLREHALAAARRASVASDAARAARDRLVLADRERDDAWRALERATAAPEPPPPPQDALADAVSADGTVAHAAFVAFRHGDLSVDELRRLWGAPAPAAEQARQARRDSLATEATARRAYDRAVAMARQVAAEVAVAEVAAQALAAEAAQAARDAAEAPQDAPAVPRRRG